MAPNVAQVRSVDQDEANLQLRECAWEAGTRAWRLATDLRHFYRLPALEAGDGPSIFAKALQNLRDSPA